MKKKSSKTRKVSKKSIIVKKKQLLKKYSRKKTFRKRTSKKTQKGGSVGVAVATALAVLGLLTFIGYQYKHREYENIPQENLGQNIDDEAQDILKYLKTHHSKPTNCEIVKHGDLCEDDDDSLEPVEDEYPRPSEKPDDYFKFTNEGERDGTAGKEFHCIRKENYKKLPDPSKNPWTRNNLNCVPLLNN